MTIRIFDVIIRANKIAPMESILQNRTSIFLTLCIIEAKIINTAPFSAYIDY